MNKRNIALLLFMTTFCIDIAADDGQDYCLIATLLTGFVVTSAATILRLATRHQDQDVIDTNNRLFGSVLKYNFYKLDDRTEDNVNNVMTGVLRNDVPTLPKELTENYQPVFVPAVQNAVKSDADQVQDRLGWDLWFRSWFNRGINDQRKDLHGLVTNIAATKKYLLTTHKVYVEGCDAKLEAEDLISRRYNNFGNDHISYAMEKFGDFRYSLVGAVDKIQDCIVIINKVQNKQYEKLHEDFDTCKSILIRFKNYIQNSPIYQSQKTEQLKKLKAQQDNDHNKKIQALKEQELRIKAQEVAIKDQGLAIKARELQVKEKELQRKRNADRVQYLVEVGGMTPQEALKVVEGENLICDVVDGCIPS